MRSIIVTLMLLQAGVCLAGEKLTYADIVERTYDVKRLALPPVKGEKGACVTSCDRGARYDEETGKYKQWSANRDGDADGLVYREGIPHENGGPWGHLAYMDSPSSKGQGGVYYRWR